MLSKVYGEDEDEGDDDSNDGEVDDEDGDDDSVPYFQDHQASDDIIFQWDNFRLSVYTEEGEDLLIT